MNQEERWIEAIEAFQLNENEIYGIVSGDLTDALPYFVSRKETDGLSDFESAEEALRVDPKLYLEDYESAIVLMVRYPVFGVDTDPLKGQIASFAVGEDYHNRVKFRLVEMAEHLFAFFPALRWTVGIDTLPLLDRQMAFQTGKVFYGKHHQVIYPPWGAGFYIGYLLTNQRVTLGYEPMTSACGSCRKCLEACPTAALYDDGFKPEKCISYLTQKKGELTQWEQKQFTTYLYGCDACLLACPFTTVQKNGEDAAVVLLDGLIGETNGEIKQRFAKSAILWRGPKLIRRNAEYLKAEHGWGVFMEPERE